MYLPTWRAISGNFLGPKMMRAKKNRKTVSEKLMGFIILPESEKRQWSDRTGHDLPDHTRQVFPAACVREPPPSRMDSPVSRNVQTWMWQGQLEFGPMRTSSKQKLPAFNSRSFIWRHAGNEAGRSVPLEELQCPYPVFPAAISSTTATRTSKTINSSFNRSSINSARISQSGNVSAAQKDYTNLKQDFQNPSHTRAHHHHRSHSADGMK
jgi:hypothetical protein